MKNSDFGDKVLDVIDQAVNEPRKLERTVPTQQPTVRCRVLRPVFLTAFRGQEIRIGDVVPLTWDEVNLAVFERFAEQLEQFAPRDAHLYQS
jgi:hypothetical protein